MEPGRGLGEDAVHMARLVLDLTMGEAERDQSGGGVGLVAEGVAGLGGRGAVIAPSVGLDDETELWPKEVDLESVDDGSGPREGEPSSEGEGEEEAFELVV